EFLDKKIGRFTKKNVEINFLIQNLKRAVKFCRDNQIFIFWIKAIYGEEKNERENDILEERTHVGRKLCCEKDSMNCEFYEEIKDLIDFNKDIVIIKNWYSAFKK